MTGANINTLLHHGPWCKNMNFGRKKVCQESKHATASSTKAEKRVNMQMACSTCGRVSVVIHAIFLCMSWRQFFFKTNSQIEMQINF